MKMIVKLFVLYLQKTVYCGDSPTIELAKISDLEIGTVTVDHLEL